MKYGAVIGKAYGFFEGDVPIGTFEAELPAIQRSVRTPPEVEFRLTNDVGNVRGDYPLKTIGRDARRKGYTHPIVTSYPGGTNRQAAIETGAVLNQAYLALFDKGTPFRGDIVFAENGKRVFLE